MDTIERRVVVYSLIFLAVFLVAVLYAQRQYSSDVPECLPYDEAYLTPKVSQIDDDLYEAFIVSRMWSFEPSVIEIPLGSELDIYLSTTDVVHGFHIKGTNVNLMAVPGGINKARVKFKKAGIYSIVCHEFCGTGHQNMQAQIRVSQY